jgi:hypothetical protein
MATLQACLCPSGWTDVERIADDPRWNFLSPSFSRRILRHVSFQTLRCLHNILHERNGRSWMSSAITCVKSKLACLPDCGSSPSSVLLCGKRVRHFFTAEISSPSQFSELWGLWCSKNGRLLAAPCSTILHLRLPKGTCHSNGAPYRSISLNFILLDSLFRKEYIYGSIIPPFSTGEVTNLSTPQEIVRPFWSLLLVYHQSFWREKLKKALITHPNQWDTLISSCLDRQSSINHKHS